MPDTPWKRHERKAAEDLGGKRNPLSGRLGGHTAGDVIHSSLYVECKYSKAFPVLKLMRRVEKNAAAARKLPRLSIRTHWSPDRYLLFRGDHLLALFSWPLNTIDEKFHEEHITRGRFAILTLMAKVEENAAAEGKLPLLSLQEKRARHRYYLIRGDILIRLLSSRQGAFQRGLASPGRTPFAKRNHPALRPQRAPNRRDSRQSQGAFRL